ncbi:MULTISPECIES: NUDIX domain-containing protein [unclassified Rhizobium]|uniref:NUDIX domain-containing protein n=1 Tax=unclassified Rhizobium TaxID=2613769 RepID=UPI0006F7C87D|nr:MULTISPECIES: NUDIX domain-containing protein [unclassified Rhizobium]KQV38267.1 DNA mismatch repair protein MutT [Rhizobium sp. Root1212]KRD30923.1 DNA mismatch repair protein MutT [Rhizobium sp. Root268]
MSDTPPEMRNWRARLVTRAVHSYFAYARGMTMGVRAACFDVEGRIFLVRHSYVPGWLMPGGGIERNETAGQALIKELREEGNLVFGDPPELMHVFHNPRTSRRDHVLFYRCRNVVQTAPKKRDYEILEGGFFPLDALPEGTTSATLRRLDELSGKVPFDDIW